MAVALQHLAAQGLGHFDAIDPGRHDAARVTRAFARRVQAFDVQALEILAPRDPQGR